MNAQRKKLPAKGITVLSAHSANTGREEPELVKAKARQYRHEIIHPAHGKIDLKGQDANSRHEAMASAAKDQADHTRQEAMASVHRGHTHPVHGKIVASVLVANVLIGQDANLHHEAMARGQHGRTHPAHGKIVANALIGQPEPLRQELKVIAKPQGSSRSHAIACPRATAERHEAMARGQHGRTHPAHGKIVASVLIDQGANSRQEAMVSVQVDHTHHGLAQAVGVPIGQGKAPIARAPNAIK